MAEENPHIEIKVDYKPIMNSRQQYLHENEKLILGRHGFIFRANPTTKEKLEMLKLEKSKINKSCKIHRNINFGKIASKNIIENYKNNSNNYHLIKSKSQQDILSQPILRFKNRTDLERICDTIQPYLPPNEQESVKEIRARHVHSIDFPRGIIYKGSVTNLKNFKNKLYSDKSDDKKAKIYFTRLQRLNIEAKKIRSNLHFKTHFKGVESVYINPKQIYESMNKEYIITDKKNGDYAYNEKQEKEKIEQMNEYKNDINDLLLEEKEKQNIINTKEFSNYLNNKEYYNDRVINDLNNKESEEERIKKRKDLSYLKQLAFKEIKVKQEKTNTNNNNNTITESENEEANKAKKNLNFENENQLRIGGKVYYIQNQMGEIAREILNKCKFYSQKKL